MPDFRAMRAVQPRSARAAGNGAPEEGYGTSMSLCVTRTIVEKDDKGYLEFNVAEADIPSEADLSEDEVRPRSICAHRAPPRLRPTGADLV
jgi:hypothetical protein